MSGYTRKFLSIEQALKEVIRKLDKEEIKEATGKSESFFRKCSDENDSEHNLHFRDAVALDLLCIKKDIGSPLLACFETQLERVKQKAENSTSITSNLLNIGSKIGVLMDEITHYTDHQSESGIHLSLREKDRVYKSIVKLEEKIIKLKLSIDKN
jgi:hypothetical protein